MNAAAKDGAEACTRAHLYKQFDGILWASRDVRDDSDDQIDTVDCTRHVVTNKCAKFLIFTLCATRDAPKNCPDACT